MDVPAPPEAAAARKKPRFFPMQLESRDRMSDLSIKNGPPKRAELQGEWVEENFDQKA
jgi:hypothetical protein